MISVINNIEVVKIVFDGSKRVVYLPFNSNVAKREIHRIIVVAPDAGEVINETTTGKQVANWQELQNSTITLKDRDNNNLVKDIALSEFSQKMLYTNYLIDSYIDTTNSFITFQYPEGEQRVLLLYFLYGKNEHTQITFDKARTVLIPANYNGKLSRFLHSNLVGNIKKITYHTGNGSVNFFIQIDEESGRSFELLSHLLFSDNGNPRKKDTFLFDGIYPDFDNSFIINGNQDFLLTFYY